MRNKFFWVPKGTNIMPTNPQGPKINWVPKGFSSVSNLQEKFKDEKQSSLEEEVTSRRMLHYIKNAIITKGSKNLSMKKSEKKKIDDGKARFKVK